MNDTHKRITPSDFFLQLGVMVALYVSAISFLTLVFSVVDAAYPKVEQYSYYAPSISWPVAMLIIVFPVYLILAWIAQKQLRANPEKRKLGFRKWLIYTTMFVTAIALLLDLITVLYYFLDGQNITTGFILKALAVLIVAGGIFKYYFFDLKGWLNPFKSKLFAGVAVILVIAAIIWGFSIIGSPLTQRLVRLDQQRVNHLEQIQWNIINYWQQKAKLPETITELNNSLNTSPIPTDPETHTPYIYEKTGDLSFKLCTTFGTKLSDIRQPRETSMIMPAPLTGQSGWQHEAGNKCFTRTIDPDLYPTTKTRIVPLQ